MSNLDSLAQIQEHLAPRKQVMYLHITVYVVGQPRIRLHCEKQPMSRWYTTDIVLYLWQMVIHVSVQLTQVTELLH